MKEKVTAHLLGSEVLLTRGEEKFSTLPIAVPPRKPNSAVMRISGDKSPSRTPTFLSNVTFSGITFSVSVKPITTPEYVCMCVGETVGIALYEKKNMSMQSRYSRNRAVMQKGSINTKKVPLPLQEFW